MNQRSVTIVSHGQAHKDAMYINRVVPNFCQSSLLLAENESVTQKVLMLVDFSLGAFRGKEDVQAVFSFHPNVLQLFCGVTVSIAATILHRRKLHISLKQCP